MQPSFQTASNLWQCAEEAKSWLFDYAAPVWAGPGRLADGMFAEALDHQARPVHIPRRIRVQARQIYVYSELGRLGWSGDWRLYVEGAINAVLAQGRRDDGFFVHTFSDTGAPLDLRADLYDHAFILFCLANAGDALNRSELFDLGDEILDLIEQRWRHPSGGFCEGEIDGAPRRQNPHMHLLEASRAMWMYSNRPRWKSLADEIAALCARRFIELRTGALTEYFTEDWERISGVRGDIVEPGHCFEWAWLFEGLAASGAQECVASSDLLAGFARKFGVQEGAVVNEVLLNGKVYDGASRVWPQTECLKAALARFRRTTDTNEEQRAMAAFQNLGNYLETPVPGLWRERRAADGNWLTGYSPASTFYHIVCALSELLRTA